MTDDSSPTAPQDPQADPATAVDAIDARVLGTDDDTDQDGAADTPSDTPSYQADADLGSADAGAASG